MLDRVCTGQLSWNSRMKERKEITLGLSDSTATADFKYSMSGKVISITYLGTGLSTKRSGEYCGGLSIGTRALLRLTGSCTMTLPGWAARSSGTERMRKLSAAMKNEEPASAGRLDRRRRPGRPVRSRIRLWGLVLCCPPCWPEPEPRPGAFRHRGLPSCRVGSRSAFAAGSLPRRLAGANGRSPIARNFRPVGSCSAPVGRDAGR